MAKINWAAIASITGLICAIAGPLLSEWANTQSMKEENRELIREEVKKELANHE